jgi:hypothetical protein
LRFEVIVRALLALTVLGAVSANAADSAPTFYRDIAPILAAHCQVCHRPGEIAPFPLVTYRDAKPWAKLIAKSVAQKKMPPWFADPCCGHFRNDPSLSDQQIATIREWAEAGAPAGEAKNAPASPDWSIGWNIAPPDLVFKMPVAVKLPANGDVEYTYEIVPTNFSQGKWVRASELRPGARSHVHHAVVYIRPPESSWLRGAPVGLPFTASSLRDPHLMREAEFTTSDLLLVYAPGSAPADWPEGLAKFIPAHSDIVFQMHYTTNGQVAEDRTSLGLVFAKQKPNERVLTLQLANDHDTIPIPPNADNYRVEVSGTLPNNCTLLGFFPHMHLRGKRFEYNLVHPDGTRQTLLRVNYDFYWQLSYLLAQPRFLPAGTKLEAIAWYNNSRSNPHNPDPDSPVEWGDQTYNEMMVGFFDIAVPAGMDKEHFFVRAQRSNQN